MPNGIEEVLRLVLAAVLGAVIGFQRERAGKEAGLRTDILICSGSALFTIMSLSMKTYAGVDPTRIAAGIVTGIGFLGAGVILHRSGGAVVGVTTAATIWVVAGIGMAAGFGFYLLALVAMVLALIALLLPHLNRS